MMIYPGKSLNSTFTRLISPLVTVNVAWKWFQKISIPHGPPNVPPLSLVYFWALETEFAYDWYCLPVLIIFTEKEMHIGASKVFFFKRQLYWEASIIYNITLSTIYSRIRQKAHDYCIDFQTSFRVTNFQWGGFCLIIIIVVSVSESNCSVCAPDGIRTHETTEVATATSAYALEGQRLGPLGHVDGRSLTFTNRHSRTSRKSGSWLWPVSVGPLKQRSKQAMYIEAKQRVRASLKSGFFDVKNYFQRPSLAVIGNAVAFT